MSELPGACVEMYRGIPVLSAAQGDNGKADEKRGGRNAAGCMEAVRDI